jgi:RNA polymerase sigma factor (sigma-70 family)
VAHSGLSFVSPAPSHFPVSLVAQTPPSSSAEPSEQWFVEEVQSHEPALRTWLRARFPWLSDVENHSREAVVRLWRRQEAGGQPRLATPKAMLFAIARNAACDEGRRRAVATMNSVAEFEHLSVLDESADVAEAVSTRQELEILAEALRELPDGCRQVLTLCKMYGNSPKEVAARLGISEHTVRAQIAKGMRRCAAFLRHRGVNRKSHAAR